MAACPGTGKMPNLTCAYGNELASWQTTRCNKCAIVLKYRKNLKKKEGSNVSNSKR